MPMRIDGAFLAHIVKLLKEYPIVEGLAEEQLEKLGPKVTFASYQDGAIVVASDVCSTGCFILLEGLVIQTCSEPGKGAAEEDGFSTRKRCQAVCTMIPPELIEARKGVEGDIGSNIVTSLGVGAMFGESGMLQKEPEQATFSCDGNCKFLVVNADIYEEHFAETRRKATLMAAKALVRQVLMEFEFFSEMDAIVQEELSTVVDHFRVPAGSVLFREGDVADQCYVLLSGEVHIWSTAVKPEDAKPLDSLPASQGHPELVEKCEILSTWLARTFKLGFTQQASRPGTRASRQGTRALRPGTRTSRPETQESSPSPSGSRSTRRPNRSGAPRGVVVARLFSGSIFGEVALTENIPRNASITVVTDAMMLVIHKPDFERLLKEAMQNAHMGLPVLVKPLLKEIQFFHALSSTAFESLPYIVRYKVIRPGHVFLWQGDVPTRCYILLSGAVEIWSTSVDKDTFSEDAEQQDAMRTPTQALSDACDTLATKLFRIDGNGEQIYAAEARLAGEIFERTGRRRVVHSGRSMVSASMTDVFGAHMGVFGPGCMIGEQSLMMEQPSNFSVTCMVHASVLQIEKRDFDRVLREDMINTKIKQLQIRLERLFKAVPLFKDLPQDKLMILPGIAQYMRAKTGTILFNQGDPPDKCYIILCGQVRVWKNNAGDDIHRHAGSKHLGSSAQARPATPPMQTVAPITPDLREKCVALARNFAEFYHSDDGGAPQYGEDVLRAVATPVAILGPGHGFGELALLNSANRQASVSCRSDCDFITISKADFDHTVKKDMQKADEEKLAFLREHVPLLKSMADKQAFAVLHFFQRKAVPRNHVFVSCGHAPNGSIFIIWSGSVESRSESTLPTAHFSPVLGGIGRNLLQGSVFGAPGLLLEPRFSVVATSPCDVLEITASSLRQMPDALAQSLRKLLEQAMARRSEKCKPLSGPSVRDNDSTGSPTSASSVPPLPPTGGANGGSVHDGAVRCAPAPVAPMRLTRSDAVLGISGGTRKKLRPGSIPRPPRKMFGTGLFQRDRPRDDFLEFELLPGEVLAATGQLPKLRDTSRAVSLPHLVTPG